MPHKVMTQRDAEAIVASIRKTLIKAGIPESLVRATAHEDVRDEKYHQSYIHVEAWAPGPSLVLELAAIEAAEAARVKEEAAAQAAREAAERVAAKAKASDAKAAGKKVKPGR